MDDFTRELRALVHKYIKPTSTFADYVRITMILEEEKEFLDEEAEKLLDKDVNGHDP